MEISNWSLLFQFLDELVEGNTERLLQKCAKFNDIDASLARLAFADVGLVAVERLGQGCLRDLPRPSLALAKERKKMGVFAELNFDLDIGNAP